MRATRKAKLSSQVGDSADRTCNVWIQRNASENSVRAVEMCSMHNAVLESYQSVFTYMYMAAKDSYSYSHMHPNVRELLIYKDTTTKHRTDADSMYKL